MSVDNDVLFNLYGGDYFDKIVVLFNSTKTLWIHSCKKKKEEIEKRERETTPVETKICYGQ